MTYFQRFEDFINKNNLFTLKDKVLLTVSGGMDSMFMLHLFSLSRFKCGVAHVNFNLRANDSIGDQVFVKEQAEKLGLPFYTIDFDTQAYAEKNKISIEMAARELRYNWFSEIREKNKYDYIATAHHANDSVETFHLNVFRGTGLRGLSGIKVKNHKIVRPLLFFTRKEISQIVENKKIKYRNDYTNQQVDFARNKIRNIVIPELEHINSAYTSQLVKTISHINEAQSFIDEQIEFHINKIKQTKNDAILYDLTNYISVSYLHFFVYEIVYPFGIHPDSVDQICNALRGTEFARFDSKTYQIFVAKYKIYVKAIDKMEWKDILISDFSALDEYFEIKKNINLDLKSVKKLDSDCVVLEKSSLKFPLVVKKWNAGDFFYPLGMNGKKKISNFLTDKKLNPIEKERVRLLADSENRIIWVIGFRMDNRFKVENFEKELLILRKKTD